MGQYLTIGLVTKLNVEQIILSLDGKIIMECYDEIFHFFARLIKERLSKYRLANALLVYISGTST
jgi:hypothetical protein